MDLLPEDIQNIIFEKTHKLMFAPILQEIAPEKRSCIDLKNQDVEANPCVVTYNFSWAYLSLVLIINRYSGNFYIVFVDSDDGDPLFIILKGSNGVVTSGGEKLYRSNHLINLPEMMANKIENSAIDYIINQLDGGGFSFKFQPTDEKLEYEMEWLTSDGGTPFVGKIANLYDK